MATAKRLPSGSYRVRVYDKNTGKYKSFTAETKKSHRACGGGMADKMSGRRKPANNIPDRS